jgi:site-specific recombinase XerD
MFNALSDFIIFCRVERRLSELTCKPYERDVRTCVEFLRSQGISALLEVRTSDLRRFLAERSGAAANRPERYARAPSKRRSLRHGSIRDLRVSREPSLTHTA